MPPETISLIVRTLPNTFAGGGDRGGGESHGLVSRGVDTFVSEVPLDKVGAQLKRILERVGSALTDVRVGVPGWVIDEIKVGLSISAEGNIGIATAGVEATIEVALKRMGVGQKVANDDF